MSSKMIEVENTSELAQAISWIPCFKWKEVRKMNWIEAERVLWNSNFRAVEAEEKPKEKVKK